jgi:hypothetical protein
MAAQAQTADFGAPNPAPAALAAAPAPAAAAPTCLHLGVTYTLGPNALCISQDNTSLIILPSEAPPSRTRLSFDSAAGEHVEVEWNPTDGLFLSRTVVLRKGPWQVSFHATPLPHSTDPNIDFAWKLSPANSFKLKSGAAAGIRSLGYVVAYLPVEQRLDLKSPNTKKSLEHEVFIDFRLAPKPRIQDVVATLGESGGVAYASGVGLRSKDLASEVVNDALEVLAEIAMERAESRALDVVKQRLLTHLCEPAQPFNATACRAAESPACDTFVLLTRSCEAIRGVRLRELASAGPGLERAVVEDFATFGSQALTGRLFTAGHATAAPALQNVYTDLALLQQQMSPVLVQISRTVITAATNRSNPNPAEIQGILHALARMVQQQELILSASFQDDEIKLMRYGLSVAIATLSLCQQSGRCNGRFIREVLESPQDHFDLGNSLGNLGQEFSGFANSISNTTPPLSPLRERYLKLLPRLETLVTQGLEVLAPPKDTPPREVAKNALLLVLAAAEVLSSVEGADDAEKAQWARVHARIQAGRDFVKGVFGRELQPLLLSSLQLIRAFDPRFLTQQDKGKSLERGTRVLGALVSYAATYERPTANGDERAQLQARRKETLNALTDIATDRKERDGESIVSLGINVGFNTIGGRKLSGGDMELQWAQLGLPLGIAYQHFCGKCPMGVHAQLSVLDLGQYAAFNKDGDATPPRWQTALVAGLQGGFIVGNPENPFVIGADLRYSPSLFPDAGAQNNGALSFGLFVGYYVPLFDLN